MLASPEAAASHGMETEARHWFSRPRDGQVLIIISSGDCKTWEEIRECLVPPAVRENLTSEPLWVPLQHRRDRIVANPADHQLHEEIAEDLKQVLLRFYPGRAWGQLRGEERSQRRRAIRLLFGTALVFLMLFVTASLLALYANYQRLVALSRESAANAEALVAFGKRGEALNSAINAFGIAATSEAREAIAHSFPQQLTRLEGHSGRVYSTAFSPDGQRVVTAGDDGTTWVWNAASGQMIANLESHSGRVYSAAFSAAFSPDGQRVVTVSGDETARVWNAATGQVLVKPEGHSSDVRSAAFSPDGQRVVTASNDGTARVWNAATGQVLAKLEGHSDAVYSAAFSPNGRRVVTGSEDHTARVWNAASGQVIAKLEGHSGPVYSAAFSPDGRRIVTAGDDSIVLIFKIVTLDDIDRLLASK